MQHVDSAFFVNKALDQNGQDRSQAKIPVGELPCTAKKTSELAGETPTGTKC